MTKRDRSSATVKRSDVTHDGTSQEGIRACQVKAVVRFQELRCMFRSIGDQAPRCPVVFQSLGGNTCYPSGLVIRRYGA
jgi:hypothetical protein